MAFRGPRFKIGGLVFEVRLTEGSGLANVVLEGWKSFVTNEAPSLMLEGEVIPPVFADLQPPFAMPEVDVTRDGTSQIKGQGFTAELAANRAKVEATLQDDWFPLDALTKVLVADSLMKRGGLLVHGCGICARGWAALYVGQSGAGKSTLFAQCRQAGMEVLSDELVALIPKGNGSYGAEGTPWNQGAAGAAQLARLGRLAWCSKENPKPATQPLPATELFRTLLPNCVMPDPSPQGRAQLFAVASRLIQNIERETLTFAPNLEAAKAIDALLPR